MNVLLAGQRIELFNTRLHIVAGNLLTIGDGIQVDLVDHLFVGRDSFGWNIHSEGCLGLHD